MKSAKDPEKLHATTRAARQPHSKILDPSDIAKARLFLLLDPSAALNGCELIAHGGLTMSFEFFERAAKVPRFKSSCSKLL